MVKPSGLRVSDGVIGEIRGRSKPGSPITAGSCFASRSNSALVKKLRTAPIRTSDPYRREFPLMRPPPTIVAGDSASAALREPTGATVTSDRDSFCRMPSHVYASAPRIQSAMLNPIMSPRFPESPRTTVL